MREDKNAIGPGSLPSKVHTGPIKGEITPFPNLETVFDEFLS